MTAERESIEFDILFVGGGPASLSGALHLSHLIKDHNKQIKEGGKKGKKLDETQIAVIEKGADMGMHALSGAVVDPRGIKELIPDFIEKGFPFEKKVKKDSVYFLTPKSALKIPIVPPPLKNHNFYITSLNKMVKWMSELVEVNGVSIFPGFPGVELLYKEGTVTGVRTGDKGVDKDGNPKGNYDKGIDIISKVTVLGEGPRGTLTKQLVNKFNLDGYNPQMYSTGVKEVWELPDDSFFQGEVIHTLGFPLNSKTFGGGFIYKMSKNLLAIGFVIGLDYKNPLTDGHNELQKFKSHPFISKLLKGGKIVHYGAKTIPEGGFYSMPQNFTDGCLIIGDSGSFLNGERLKGIHLAIKSGILCAETIFDALIKDDFSKNQLGNFPKKVKNSWIHTELFESRYFRQNFRHGLYWGIIKSGIDLFFKTKTDKPILCQEDHKAMETVEQCKKNDLKYEQNIPDGTLTVNKVTDVFYSKTIHEKDQPCHLQVSDQTICNGVCKVEFKNPCQHFCPANVYEMVDEGQSGETKLRINAENCVHCKTCDIADPYGIITWVPPEGGGGPKYTNM